MDSKQTEDQEYYVYPVSDYQEHTPERPFCGDMSCPCHEDQDNIEELGGYYQDGLVSGTDADNIYHGRIV